MYQKIDDTLYRVHIENIDKIPVVIYANEYNKLYQYIVGKYSNVKLFPFISAIGVLVDYNDIFYISGLNYVRYITSVSGVCSSMYIVKKISHIDKIYTLSKNTNNATIAIIDTGIYPHIDFVLGKNRIVKFVDLISNKSAPYDDNGHGTFVSGVVGALDIVNGDKYSGVDTSADIIMIKALNQNGETDSIKILEAMQWVMDNKEKYNIRVVCMSFGSVPMQVSDPLMIGAEVLWNSGVVVVAAAGNSGPDSGTIKAPGSESRIITVGALNDGRNDEFKAMSVADFSSRGPIFDRYKPDLIASGVDVISTARFGIDNMFYTAMSGTSVSTPIVAGVALLLVKHNPRYTPDEIKYMILRSTESIGYDRNSEGFGMLNMSRLTLL